MAQEGILVGVLAQHRKKRFDSLRVSNISEGYRGEKADSQTGIAQRSDQALGRSREPRVAKDFRGLSPDFSITIFKQRLDHAEGIGMNPANLAQAPNGMKPGKGVPAFQRQTGYSFSIKTIAIRMGL